MKKSKKIPFLDINLIDGYAQEIPICQTCKSDLRPNIQVKDDLEFVEDHTETEMK